VDACILRTCVLHDNIVNLTRLDLSNNQGALTAHTLFNCKPTLLP